MNESDVQRTVLESIIKIFHGNFPGLFVDYFEHIKDKRKIQYQLDIRSIVMSYPHVPNYSSCILTLFHDIPPKERCFLKITYNHNNGNILLQRILGHYDNDGDFDYTMAIGNPKFEDEFVDIIAMICSRYVEVYKK